MSKEEQIKEFLAELSEGVYKLIQDSAKKHGLEDDYIFALTAGVYNDESEDNNNLIMSLTADVDDEFEFNSLIEGAVQVYLDVNKPKDDEGTIDWWIRNYGNGSVN